MWVMPIFEVSISAILFLKASYDIDIESKNSKIEWILFALAEIQFSNKAQL